MGRVGFKPTTPPCQGSRLVTNLDMDNDVSVSNDNLGINWTGYKEYLKTTCIENTVKVRYNYSIKYQKYILNLNTIFDLLTFSLNKRLHIMKTLSSLSKYLVQRYVATGNQKT